MNGALTMVGVEGEDVEVSFSTPVEYEHDVDVATPLGRTLNETDGVYAVSILCDKSDLRRIEVGNCSALKAPVLQQPFVGDDFVAVTESLPGATILIYDEGQTEIGDGAGATIQLSRPLIEGDVITAVQATEVCSSANGFQIAPICKAPNPNCN